MSSPQWATFVDAVLAALRADSAIGGASIPVLDGQTVAASDSSTALVIGGSFNDEDSGAGGFLADWRSDGGAFAMREETLTVRGGLQAWVGEADIASARTLAFTLLGDVSRVLRTTPGLGVAALLWCHLTLGDVTQELRSGAVVTVNFTITARTVI